MFNFQDPLAEFGTHAQMTVREDDNTFFIGDQASGLYRDRFEYDRATVLAECLRAWRVSPIARRIVKLITEFIIGEGLSVKSDHKATHKFLQEWWSHPLNKLAEQVAEWSDEFTRTGNLFFLITAANDGMTFIRCVPSELVKEIQTAENDVFQETYYVPVNEQTPWPAYNPREPIFKTEDKGNGYSEVSAIEYFALHYTANRPIGTNWGEPDLAPLLPWIGRYSTFLEDRVRINHWRTAFMYTVTGNYESEEKRAARERAINANPPKPGSVLVQNASQGEIWGVLSAQLEAFDAEMDGLALKKIIALGAEIPLHYLAEPESSTSTTAEASGTPAFRSLEQKQTRFANIILDLATIAVKVRKEVDKRVKPDSKIEVNTPDITERDNSNLALAAGRMEQVAADLFDRKLIDEDEMLRLTYRMGGEVYEPNPSMKGKGVRRPLKPTGTQSDAKPIEDDDKADPLDKEPVTEKMQRNAEHFLQLLADASDAIGHDRVIDILKMMEEKRNE